MKREYCKESVADHWNRTGDYQHIKRVFGFPSTSSAHYFIHYMRRLGWDLIKPTKKTLFETLFEHVTKTECGCWEWNRNRSSQGYGLVRMKGVSVGAHCAAWIKHNQSQIPDGMVVMHLCDNPPCINPLHLSLGTYKDNTRDCAKKNRRASQKGESNPSSKLTSESVKEIRKMRLSGATFGELSVLFGVSRHTCAEAASGKTWGHVK